MVLHHTGVGFEGKERKDLNWKPHEAGFDFFVIMVPIILAKQECLRDGYSHCWNQNRKKG